jgi:streptogramin lyase
MWFLTEGSTVAAGTLDDVWIGVLNSGSGGGVARFSKAGVELGRYSVGDGFRSAYTAIDQEGNAWVSAMQSDWSAGGPTSKGRLIKFTGHGDQLGVFELSNGTMPQDVEIGADGRVWVVSGGTGPGTVTWFNADGGELGHYAMDKVFPYRFAAASNGAWVISDHQKGVIVHVAP